MTNQGVLSEVGPDASGFLGVFGEKKGQEHQVSSLLCSHPETEGHFRLEASHQGEKISVQQKGGWQRSAASRFTPGW